MNFLTAQIMFFKFVDMRSLEPFSFTTMMIFKKLSKTEFFLALQANIMLGLIENLAVCPDYT